jgi:hypothetical protein
MSKQMISKNEPSFSESHFGHFLPMDPIFACISPTFEIMPLSGCLADSERNGLKGRFRPKFAK